MALEREDTLLFFTDGLVERPGEPLEVGLDRLADAVAEAGQMRLEAVCDLAVGHRPGVREARRLLPAGRAGALSARLNPRRRRP